MIVERLRILREAHGFSQQYLAIEFNVSQTMISKYELGQAEPDINIICSIAKFFRVSTDYLLGVSDSKYNMPDSLSEAEKEILFGFKKLDSLKKAKLQAYLQGLLEE